jgi:ribosomal protein S18 acetylase RimI-like enzyme
MEKFFRMRFSNPRRPLAPLADFIIRPYQSSEHKKIIPHLYADSFADPPWKMDWDDFPYFDPKGVFLAKAGTDGSYIGYIISFHRPDYGYISVVAVLPKWRRKGVASALVGGAIDFLLMEKKCSVLIDVEQTNDAAIKTYESCGAKTIDSLEE